MKVALHWFRRDLRVTDNTALFEAARRAERVIPVFILEDALRSGPDVGGSRLAFLFQSLESLRRNLEVLGYPLVIRSGRSVDVIPQLARELGAEGVFANRRYESYALKRDDKIRGALASVGIGFEVFKDAVAWEGREVLTQAGNPFTVFTPYSKAWKLRPTPAPVGKLPPARGTFPQIASEPLPTDSGNYGHAWSGTLPPAGERAANEALKRFLAGPVLSYAEQRNFPAIDGTSNLSIHLRAGTIGVRHIYAQLAAVRERANAIQQKSCDTWLAELLWREFYQHIFVNFPHVTRGAFRAEYDALEWEGTDAQFDAWCAGMTGYPIVDAAMRCLNETGMMHNRLRMIVAMFLTKDLLIHWQRGEMYFMKQLIDGDAAANNGGWQWSAGCGTDAAPYFRIFNPITQGQKFDPEGEFVRRWVPELRALPGAMVHTPGDAGLLDASARAYPKPIVQHDVQRGRCLAMFAKVKKPAAGKADSAE